MKKFLLTVLVAGFALAAFGLFHQPPVVDVGAHFNQPTPTPTPKCEYSCPVVHFEWITSVCPEGYSHESQSHPGYCYKGSNPRWPSDYKGMVVTPHQADVQYDKSQDPTKCHRPSDSVLESTYGMDKDAKDDFKKDNAEWKNSIKTCPTPTPTPTVEPTATPTPPPQCEDDCVTPTPTPSPEPPPFVDTTHGNGGDPGPAPMCSGPAPVVQPRNFGCIRNGATAHCSWVPGDESIADIFFSEGKVTTPPLTWPHALVVDYSQYAVHGQADINDLVIGRDYTFALRSRNACSGGNFVYEVVVDGAAKGKYFPMTYFYLAK